MRLLLVGYYGGINYGDEALAQVIAEKAKEIYPDVEIISLTLDEQYTRRIHNLYGIPYDGLNTLKNWQSFKRLLKAIEGSDIVIIGGGGVLHDMKNRLSMTFYLFPIILSKLLGKPTAFFSVAVDPPIHSSLNKMLLRLTCNVVDHISVRDVMSKTYLERIGVKKKINLIGDPVLMLKPEQKELETVFKQENINLSKLIGVNIRQWGKLDEKVVDKLPQVLDTLIEEGYQIIFLCSPNDIEISKEIVSKIKNNNDCRLILATKYKPSLILGLISKFDLILTMRLHFAISAVVVGTPCVTLPYLYKVEDFTETFSLPHIDIDSESIPDMLRTLRSSINNTLGEDHILRKYQESVFADLTCIFELDDKTPGAKERIKAFFTLCFLFWEVLWFRFPIDRSKVPKRYW